MPHIEYLLVQKENSSYTVRIRELTSDLPDTCQIDALIQEAAIEIRRLMSLDSSLPIDVNVYTLNKPLLTFRGLSEEALATAVGDLDQDFSRKVTYLSSRDDLSFLFPDQDGKGGKVLVVFSLPQRQRSPYSIEEEGSVRRHISREKIVDAARKRSSPSTGAHNSTLLSTQRKGKPDAIYNGRPIALTAPPISIYHPVFSTFQKKMRAPLDNFKFSTADLRRVRQFVIKSVSFYENGNLRTENLDDLRVVHGNILDPAKFTEGSKSFLPDGCTRIDCELFKRPLRAVTSFTEVKNGIGEGGSDPIHQAQCDYVAFYSSEARRPLRDACCCPSFLVGIAGPYMIISGAVFVDCFISQPLTDYIYIGGRPYIGDRLYKIAKVLTILRECILELEEFYSGLPPVPTQSSKASLTASPPVSPSFPHFQKFTTNDGSYILQYIERLRPENSEKAVFKASARASGSDKISAVVVKFAITYSQRGHQLLADRLLAPKLWFCEVVESVGMYVIVMDYVQGRCVDDVALIPAESCKAIGKAIEVLHANNLVFGDLRPPNAIISEDPAYTKGAVLIDFEWCGEDGKALYPPDLNEDTIEWHQGVCPGGRILREHDSYMLDQMYRKGT